MRFFNRLWPALALGFLYALVLFAPARAQDSAQESAAQFFAADRARMQAPAPSARPQGRARPHSGVRANMGRGVHPRLIAFARRFNCTIISGYRPGARVAGTPYFPAFAVRAAKYVRVLSPGFSFRAWA